MKCRDVIKIIIENDLLDTAISDFPLYLRMNNNHAPRKKTWEEDESYYTEYFEPLTTGRQIVDTIEHAKVQNLTIRRSFEEPKLEDNELDLVDELVRIMVERA